MTNARKAQVDRIIIKHHVGVDEMVLGPSLSVLSGYEPSSLTMPPVEPKTMTLVQIEEPTEGPAD